MKIESRKRGLSLQAVAAASLVILFGLLSIEWAVAGADTTGAPAPKPRITDFPHNSKAHRVECSKCHKFPSENWKTARPEKEAFPDITEYPKHETCLGCHKQLFFKGASPRVCSICHVNPGPRDSRRHPFSNPREVYDLSPKGKLTQSDFVIAFPHDKHTEIVSQARSGVSFENAAFMRPDRRRAAEESCAVCHKTMEPQGTSTDEYVTPPPAKLGDGFWLKKGTFKTAPLGHASCFTCHSADSGMTPGPTDCATCHKLSPTMPRADFDAKLATAMKIQSKVMMDAWRLRSSSGKYQHEFMAHADMPCSTCHTVEKMKTDDPSTLKVPITSCATCHATASSADGGAINAEIDARKANPKFECIKCHTAFGKLPVPESHAKAVADAGK